MTKHHSTIGHPQVKWCSVIFHSVLFIKKHMLGMPSTGGDSAHFYRFFLLREPVFVHDVQFYIHLPQFRIGIIYFLVASKLPDKASLKRLCRLKKRFFDGSASGMWNSMILWHLSYKLFPDLCIKLEDWAKHIPVLLPAPHGIQIFN